MNILEKYHKVYLSQIKLNLEKHRLYAAFIHVVINQISIKLWKSEIKL